MRVSREMMHKARHYRASGKSGTRAWRRYALITALVILIAFVLQLALRHLFFYPLTIASDSMEPEVRSGDKRYFTYPRLSPPAMGDVVLVKPAGADVQLLCRIVAADGDKVRISDAILYVNGSERRRLKPRLRQAEDRSFTLAETEVRPNFVFCLNDNEQNTNDSRLHGSFARSQIIGRMIKPALFF